MPKVVREETGELTAAIKVQVERADYEPKLKSELKKYQSQAHMKGFRKGKTPMSVIRKMYGKSALAEIVNELLQKELVAYIEKEDMSMLGQPLPSEEQEPVDFDLQDLTSYEFTFDVGLEPEFEVQGVTEDNTFEKYQVEVPDETVAEELADARKRLGERVQSDGDIQEGDLLKLKGVEFGKDTPKEGGIDHDFSVLVNSLKPDMKEVFTTKKVGERLVANVFELEEKGDEQYVRKYFLGLEEEDDREVNPTFELTIEEATRIEEAPLDEKFFQGYFGEDTEVTSEEEAREKIRENIAGYYNKQAEALLFRDMQKDLMEKNKPALPNDFLKRWILASNEEATAADVDKDFDTFTENLRWTLVRNRLAERFELRVEEGEIITAFKDRVRGYLAQNPGMMDDSFIDQMAMRLAQDQKQVEQVHGELLTDKLYDALVEVVTIEDKPIAMDEFLTIAQEAQRQSAATIAEEEE